MTAEGCRHCAGETLPPGTRCRFCARGALPPNPCRAHGCTTAIPTSILMCPTHWLMVPKPAQRSLWSCYRSGAVRDAAPSSAHLVALDTAIALVARKEGRALTPHFTKLLETYDAEHPPRARSLRRLL